MNGREFRKEINIKRPRYAESQRSVLELLSLKGSRKGEFLTFGPFYEIYMYAFFIGFNRGERLPLLESSRKDQFREIGLWKPEGIVDYILMLMFSKKEILKYTWDELEDLDNKEIEEVISNVIKAIEEYANAGLSFLKDKIDNERNEFTDPFVFINILNDVVNSNPTENKEYNKKNTDIVNESKELLLIRSKIEKGEDPNVEFKSTLRYCMHQNKVDKTMEHTCMKTIAGFLNSEGGTLFIGVDDNKKILGLNLDFKTFNKLDKIDEFQKHLDNLISSYFDDSVYTYLDIKLHKLSEGVICEIKVKPSVSGHIMMKNRADKGQEEFYIRRAASTKSLTPNDMIRYINSHWLNKKGES